MSPRQFKKYKSRSTNMFTNKYSENDITQHIISEYRSLISELISRDFRRCTFKGPGQLDLEFKIAGYKDRSAIIISLEKIDSDVVINVRKADDTSDSSTLFKTIKNQVEIDDVKDLLRQILEDADKKYFNITFDPTEVDGIPVDILYSNSVSPKEGGRRSHKKTRRSHKKNHKKTLRRRR
jgi:hypothetical protein